MDDIEILVAIEAIKQAKARYFRGVDTRDDALVKGVLAEDCVLDYKGCCVDPASGRDFLPAMNVVLLRQRGLDILGAHVGGHRQRAPQPQQRSGAH